MPWSQTPVVTCILAIAHTSLLPSAQFTVSAFISILRLIQSDHDYTFFGAQYRACYLAPSSSGLPSPGLPVDFANELLAKLCSCGTSADPTTQRRSKLRNEIYCLILSPYCQGKPCNRVHCTFQCAVTHWVTLSNFIYLSVDSQRFGLRWARALTCWVLPICLNQLLLVQ